MGDDGDDVGRKSLAIGKKIDELENVDFVIHIHDGLEPASLLRE